MALNYIKKLFNITILFCLITATISHPITTRASNRIPIDKRGCTSCNKCPGSTEIKASLLEQFKQLDLHATNKTIAIRYYNWFKLLSATKDEVKIEIPSNNNLQCENKEDIKFFFYKYEYTINGTKMMSLVPVGSPDLIVTWGPVNVGSSAIDDTTYVLKTENITRVFAMMSSNTTQYHNWRFKVKIPLTPYYVKILTEELYVTNDDTIVTLQERITDENNYRQSFVLCEDCPEDW